jgi:asparagine N-glycosylation enzyme membrane subunit Stt3
MALAAGAAVIVATPAAADAILGGSHFLGGDPWLRTISEFQPVITEAPIDLVSDVALLSGGLILVWPFAVRAWRRRDLTEGTIALFAITYLVLDLSSRRFRPLAIVFLALAGAIEASRIFTTSRRRSVAIAAMLLIVSPPAIQLLLWRSQPIADTHPSWFRAAAFFRSQTAGGRVLAPWSMGHLLDVVGGRPVIVDNFGSMPDAIDFARANDALLTKDERTLARYCDENAIRWVVFTEPLGGIAEAAAVNDLDQTRYVDGKQARPLARATCWWRAIHGGAALTRFRRVDAEGTSGRILERVR